MFLGQNDRWLVKLPVSLFKVTSKWLSIECRSVVDQSGCLYPIKNWNSLKVTVGWSIWPLWTKCRSYFTTGILPRRNRTLFGRKADWSTVDKSGRNSSENGRCLKHDGRIFVKYGLYFLKSNRYHVKIADLESNSSN